VQTVQGLLDRGADKDAKSEKGRTPMHHACKMGNLPVVRTLLDAGASVNHVSDEGCTPMHFGCYEGHLPIVVELGKRGADMDQRNAKGSTPFYVGRQNGHLPVVLFLLEHGINVDEANNKGATPLYVGSQKGHLCVVQALLKHGVEVDKGNDAGATPLMIAAKNGHLEVVKLLVQKGADTTREARHGATAMDVAKLRSGGMETPVSKYLAQVGACDAKKTILSLKTQPTPTPDTPLVTAHTEAPMPKKRRTFTHLKIRKKTRREKCNAAITPVISAKEDRSIFVGKVIATSAVVAFDDLNNKREKWRSEQVRLCFSPAFNALKVSISLGVKLVTIRGAKHKYHCKKCRQLVLNVGETMNTLQNGDSRQLTWDVRSFSPCKCI
jgi:hypothetical protein